MWQYLVKRLFFLIVTLIGIGAEAFFVFGFVKYCGETTCITAPDFNPDTAVVSPCTSPQ